jgi:hypothetical protein
MSDLNSRSTGLSALLRALPGEAAAPYGYPEFERRAQERARRARGLAGGERLAAACLLAAGLLAVMVRLGAPAGTGHSPVAGAAALVRAAPGPEDETLPPHAGLAERWLASLPQEPAIVHVGTRAAVLGIEDRIAQIDDVLSTAGDDGDAPARLATLRQERARLVGTLVQVRYAEALADGSL